MIQIFDLLYVDEKWFTSLNWTSYGIHIHELNKLCHITIVWVSN
jgi:hypothetical protein